MASEQSGFLAYERMPLSLSHGAKFCSNPQVKKTEQSKDLQFSKKSAPKIKQFPKNFVAFVSGLSRNENTNAALSPPMIVIVIRKTSQAILFTLIANQVLLPLQF